MAAADESYFAALSDEISRLFSVARRARATGKDVSLDVEVALGNTLPDRISALFESGEIGERVSYWLDRGLDKLGVAFRVAGEIVSGEIPASPPDRERLAELAVRVGLAVVTDATVSAPIEGLNSVRIKRRSGGPEYLAVYYNGPIRTAGGTEGAVSVLLADYARQKLGIPPYEPTRAEVDRYVEEIALYRREVHLQYNSTPEEIREAAGNVPVEVTGPPTERVEVSANRDLPGVESNRVRGGAMLVLNDCIIQKRRKLAKIVSRLERELDFDGSRWRWLSRESGGRGPEVSGSGCPAVVPSYKYMKDAVVGRPVLAHPSRSGGFRLRYGHARNTGLASVGIHPATMVILEGFVGVGTQVRMERPGKSAVVMPVDSIEGPVVLLKDGTVVRVDSEELAEEIADSVQEVLHLGDVLIGFGEFLENNHPLLPSGWTEEWWAAEVAAASAERGEEPPRYALPPYPHPKADEAIEISLRLGVPLHPRWTYFWHDITVPELARLVSALADGRVEGESLLLRGDGGIKDILERLGVPHSVRDGWLVVSGDDSRALLASLGGGAKTVDPSRYAENDALGALNDISPFRIMPKAPVRVGMRVGRPEKAKARSMRPAVNALFPLGLLKGHSRQMSVALRGGGTVRVQIAMRRCPSCGKKTPLYTCVRCGVRTERLLRCSVCGAEVPEGGRCPSHPAAPLLSRSEETLDVRSVLSEAAEDLGGKFHANDVRGVKKLMNASASPEPLQKALIRSSRGLFIFKDGTIRFDATNASLTHFRPSEVGTPLEKLREMGYRTDYLGNPLEREDQLLELKVQDVVLPRSAAEYLYKVSKYVDDLLEHFYGLPRYYNLESPDDLVGHVVFTISPHTFVANAARVIGFTDADVAFAHPYLHAAKRRNVDGDEDSFILGLECLLDFSREYLPSTPGGREDAPMILVGRLDLGYIDDECYNIEVVDSYPEEFFRATWRYADPSDLEGAVIETVGTALSKGERYPSIGFTAWVTDIAAGPLVSAYRSLNSMVEKLERHVELEKKIRAVDPEDAIRRAMSAHFLRDIAGNLRRFGSQEFRCVKCNARYRRPPLSGRCPKCGGDLVLTIYPKSAVKYLEPTKSILKRYRLEGYVLQRVNLLEEESRSVFKGILGPSSTELDLGAAGLAGEGGGEAARGGGESRREGGKTSRTPSLLDFL